MSWPRLVRLSLIAAVTATLAACGDDGGAEDTDGGGQDPTSTDSDPSDGGEATVSFAQDVRPIFATRCTLCHHDNSAIDIDITDPFSAPNALVGSINTWAVAKPEGGTPMLNVDPGNPEGSFLLDKVGDPALLDNETAGAHMPLNMEPLTPDELADLRAWITAGASNDAMFEDRIRPIFGEITLGSRSGKCAWCHHGFPGGQPPNLVDPFDPDNGAVGVASIFGDGMLRIAPGDPDNSVLVIKVEATEAGMFGGPMPPQYEPLTAQEVATLETWIAEGAPDN